MERGHPNAAQAAARAALHAERERLLGELAVEPEGPSEVTYGSQAAAATHVFEQQRDLALRDRNQDHLRLVDAALARIDAGTFGRCLRCGNEIAAERLEALPWAAYCITCQQAIAREASGQRAR